MNLLPSRQAPAQEKILLESTTGDFFGFNTTSFASRGVIGGIRDSFTGIYDNIVKDYVTDVYTDVIEGYTIATIKLFGWFFFGGFLIMKGALLNGLVEDIGGKFLFIIISVSISSACTVSQLSSSSPLSTSSHPPLLS